MEARQLIAFEKRVAKAFAAKKCKGPIHLSGGNEKDLIEIFSNIGRDEWVFSTYRSHYHALLHGIPAEWLYKEILEGRSMSIHSVQPRFMSSAIVGGMLPIAVGVAYANKLAGVQKMVHCFVGDMAATTGAFREALEYSIGHRLHIRFYVEDNGLSCDTPTRKAWGAEPLGTEYVQHYEYTRTYPHSGIGQNVF